MRKRLLAVQGPIQFIAGYIAMEWYKNIKHGSENSEDVLLMYDFLMPEHMEPEFVNAITRMATQFKWHSIVFISSAEMSEIMKGNYSKRIEKLHSTLGVVSFDEVIIGRDFCGDGSPLVINAYPSATRILYGDSLGIVGNEAITDLFDWRWPIRSLASRCKRFLLDLIHGKHEKFTFDAAVLTLPVDWSGTYLVGLPLLIPDRDFVVKNITVMIGQLPELKDYADLLVNKSDNNYLFLLSNLSASGLMSQENEIELYLEIIYQTAPKGATIFLKAHPRGPRIVFNSVAENIKSNYRVIIVDDKELASYPIELWAEFIQHCVVVPIYSASAYHIKYIYGKDVVLTLDDDRICKYVYQDRIHIVSKGNLSIANCVKNLNKWDGNSPLWKGC